MLLNATATPTASAVSTLPTASIAQSLPTNPTSTATPAVTHVTNSSSSSLKKFVYPGIVRYSGGNFEGGDHLLGIGRNISVDLEIYSDAAAEFPLKREDLLKGVTDLFQEYRFHTDLAPPYLPFFYIVIIALPIDRGFSVYVSGRLIEKVEVRNLQFDPSVTWQAITWERESFQVLSKEDVAKEVSATVNSIAKTFIDRVSFFESLPQQETPKSTYSPTDNNLKNRIQIKESVPKIPPHKPLPDDPKKKREALLQQLKTGKQ